MREAFDAECWMEMWEPAGGHAAGAAACKRSRWGGIHGLAEVLRSWADSLSAQPVFRSDGSARAFSGRHGLNSA